MAGCSMIKALILTVVCFFSAAASAASPGWAGDAVHGDDILGMWLIEERDAKIEIFKCGEEYCGRIVWMKAPVYPVGDSHGRAGQPRLDDNDPDPKLRSRPLEGLKIIDGFIYNGNGQWQRGTVYDPKNGHTYKGKMSLVTPDVLQLRGYVLLPLFGRTTTWTRSVR